MPYRPARFDSGPLLSAADRHLVTRFSYGLTPKLVRDVKKAGNAKKWLRRQLRPHQVRDRSPDVASWWSGLSRDPQSLWERSRDGVEGGWEVMADYQRYLLMRRIHSRHQVLEVMTEVWENHFNVPVSGDLVYTWRKDYGDTVREHALGRFEDLLQAVVTHPAMLLYLDGAVSTKANPNENLGRELLELHTLGRGTHTEDDVKASARILTGWKVARFTTFAASYDKGDHWTGPVQVGDFSHPNADRDGREVTRAYLSYLAHHPATARRVARRLAVKFVSDDPSDALVEKLASTYLDHDTAIKPVLMALVGTKEFRTSRGAKVRDPGEDVVATYRVLRPRFSPPPEGGAGDKYAATAVMWQTRRIGQAPMDWPRPDGAPIDNASWSSPARLTASLDMHWSAAGRWWPGEGIRWRSPMQWMPRKRIRFDLLVDHMCQELLGKRSNRRLLEAACQACQVRPREVIDKDHPVVRWRFHWLIGTLLDTPDHLTR